MSVIVPELPDSPAILSQVDPRFTLEASGHWEVGGSLKLGLDGECVEDFSLSPLLWSIVAILMQFAKQSPGRCMPAKELARRLDRFANLGDGNPQNATRGVYRLRQEIINRMAQPKYADLIPDAESWCKQLIECIKRSGRNGRGYRIGLPADNLTLVFDSPADGNDPADPV